MFSTTFCQYLLRSRRGLTSVRIGSFLLMLAAVQLQEIEAHAGLAGLERLATGLDLPVFATHAPGDRERLFIVEKTGSIKILNLADNSVNPQPFLTIGDTEVASEAGLLGLAFHPNYANNGKFYVYVTVADGGTAFRSHVREYTVSANPDIADPNATEILIWDQPQSNHNAGWIGFGPNDGYLYVMSGDGGGGNDTGGGHTAGTGNAQDTTNNLLGKSLRIDVNGTGAAGGNYAIPSSNPFVNKAGDDEIWAYGLRNPFRASFDRKTGDLWIGDVGQSAHEEIDKQLASSLGGENYGWRVREGLFKNPAYAADPDPNGAIDPVHDYAHSGPADEIGFAVIGGYVYRGPDPELQGTYFFTDNVTANFWTLNAASPAGSVQNINSQLTPDVGVMNFPSSFGEDALGNLYVVDLATSLNPQTPNTGDIFRIVTNALVPGDFNADGNVDDGDLEVWEAGYGMTSGALATDGDADDDGDVDGDDFLLWQVNVGENSMTYVPPLSASTIVPEPGTILLAALGLTACGFAALCRARGRAGTL